MRIATTAVCVLVAAFAAMAQEPVVKDVAGMENVADSGTHGDVIMTSPAPYNETGVLLQPKPAWPYVVAGTGTSDATSAFVVHNPAIAPLLWVRGDGNVGIGTSQPAARLHVVGDVRFDGTVTGTYIKAHYQDVAEWVPASEDLAPGTVVVLDKNVGNGVVASSRAYDTTVAGVVSAQPGIVLGEEGASSEQVAASGRVRVKVDASHGPIAIGDLLVTSDRPGYAMRSTPIDAGGVLIHRPGTIVGKALEPLRAGQGEILVLLSLQ